ncbi:MAG: ABC transporter permease [Cellulophaga sp.]
MYKNYLKIAWRNAVRQKQFSILNLLGLTIGVGTCLVIGLYIHSELTYDTFHKNSDRIYRINQSNIWGDFNDLAASTGPNVATAIKEDIPEFEEVTRLMGIGSQTIRYGNSESTSNFFKENFFAAAEPNFLDIFSFEMLQGDAKTALNEPMSILMTQETATRYFGENDPIDKVVEIKEYDGSWRSYTVKGVFKDIPAKSHLQFDALISMNSYQAQLDRDGWKWIWTTFSTYGLLHKDASSNLLAKKLQALPKKWAPPTTERIFNQTFTEFTKGNTWLLVAQPLKEIYKSGLPLNHSFGPTGNPSFITIFGAIGILVLVLSCINFMNLSTARSSKRAREIGVRKVLGSGRTALIKQFIIESVLFTLLSTILAIGVVYLSLGIFNTVAETDISLVSYLNSPLFYGIIFLFVLLLGGIAGSYPAFYLSSFKPVETLKGKLSVGSKGKNIRNGLIVFQFTISIALIICAFFVHKQLVYASTLDVGFAKNNILQIHNIEELGFDTEALKTKLKENPAFLNVGKSFGVPPNIWSGDRYKTLKENEVFQFKNIRADEDYLDVLGLELVAGRNFDSSRPNDKYKVILNEEAVKMVGWGNLDSFAANSPTGKIIALASGGEDEFEVLGVVKNFNFNSVKQHIDPLIIIHHQNNTVWDYGGGQSYYSLRLNAEMIQNTQQLQSVVESVKSAIVEIDPSVPFEYSFLDQDFENTFQLEQRMGTVLNFFTLMAMIIACLGLFGLAVFSAEQRIQELGIRKVLGAKVSELVLLFSTEFMKLIGIAILIASPLAYILITSWLSDFAYKTPITFWVFLLAGLSAFVITILTVSLQAVKAARANPIKSLRTE